MSRLLLAVGCGGALGALARYGVTSVLDIAGVASWTSTLVINLLGSALIGWGFIVIEGRRAAEAEEVIRRGKLRSAFWLTGVLGGFTTFSTFSLDVVKLLEAGDLTTAGVLIVLSVFGCALGTVAGVVAAGGQLSAAR